jgi:hypothetical protein
VLDVGVAIEHEHDGEAEAAAYADGGPLLSCEKVGLRGH